MGLDALFLADSDTNQILECNAKASQLFGYTSQELLSMKMTDFSKAAEVTHGDCLQNPSKNGRDYQTKDGKIISVEVTFENICLADRPVYLAIIRDITDKKQAQKALREKTRFCKTLLTIPLTLFP